MSDETRREEENHRAHQLDCPLSRLILYAVNLLPPDDASRRGAHCLLSHPADCNLHTIAYCASVQCVDLRDKLYSALSYRFVTFVTFVTCTVDRGDRHTCARITQDLLLNISVLTPERRDLWSSPRVKETHDASDRSLSLECGTPLR